MLLLACTVNPFWLLVKALILLALYDQSTLICHFKAPFLVDYKNICCKVPCSWVEISSWVEYILGLHDTFAGVNILENLESLAVPEIWRSLENLQKPLWAWTEKCQDLVLTRLKITTATFFDPNDQLWLVCLFFENGILLLLLQDFLQAPGLHTCWHNYITDVHN